MRLLARVAGLLICALLVTGFAGDRVQFATGWTYSWDKDRQQIAGLLFRPAGDRQFPAVVILHTCRGLLPHVSEDWPQYLTALGYVVLTVDSYSPRGYSKCTESGTWQNDQKKDAFGALEYLSKLPFVDAQRVALMGFSAGAFAINETLIGESRNRAGMSNFKAAISVYGRCSDPLRNYRADDIPLMMIIGEHDVWRMICEGDWMKERPIEVHVLQGAHHSFDQRHLTSDQIVPQFWFPDAQDNLMRYDAAKTQEARELVRRFLARHLW